MRNLTSTLMLLFCFYSFASVFIPQKKHVITEDGVYYGCVNCYGEKLKKIKCADKNTFDWLGSENEGNYAKDKKHVYYQNKIIIDADTSTISHVGEEYATDKNHVYYKGEIMIGLDSESFCYLSYGYSKDRNHVYFNGNVISNYPKNFKLIGHYYSIDEKNIIYFDGIEHKIVEGADVNNYKNQGDIIISNKKVFLFGEEMDVFDSITFEIIESQHCLINDIGNEMLYFLAKDKNGYYVNGIKIDSSLVSSRNFDMSIYAKPLIHTPRRKIK